MSPASHFAAFAIATAVVVTPVSLSSAAANYDATGIWTLAECSEDCFFFDLVQNARGDLTLRDGFCAEVDCHVEIRFRRVGPRLKTGAIGEFTVTIRGLENDERECINQEGIAVLDSSTDPSTLTVTVTGVNWQGPDAGCQPETNFVVFER